MKEKNGYKIIHRNTDGRYEIRLKVSTGNYTSVYARTEQEVIKKAKAREKEISKCKNLIPCKTTLERYMTKWLETRRVKLKPNSYARIEGICKYQIFPTLGHMQVQAITADNIQDLLNELADTYSYSTIKKTKDYLNACFSLGVKKGEIATNPVAFVEIPKENIKPDKEIRIYTPEEIRAIAEECTRVDENGNYVHRYGNAFLLMLNTGMRLGELLFLKWKDVDLQNRIIRVEGDSVYAKVLDKESGIYRYSMIDQKPKTKSSQRRITLSDNAILALEGLKKAIGDNTRVVATQTHNTVSARNMYKYFKRILDNCGINDANDIIHALRHTFASQLLTQNVSVAKVSKLLGHDNINTTHKAYYHFIHDDEIETVKLIDNLY